MKVKTLLVILAIAGSCFAQAPTCSPITTPAEANACAASLLIWASIQSDTQVKTALTIQADAITQLQKEVAPLLLTPPPPSLSVPKAVVGVGTVTISWTATVAGQGVIVYGTTPGAYSSTLIPTGTTSFSVTIAKPKGTTLYYRVKLNYSAGQLISPEYNVKIL